MTVNYRWVRRTPGGLADWPIRPLQGAGSPLRRDGISGSVLCQDRLQVFGWKIDRLPAKEGSRRGSIIGRRWTNNGGSTRGRVNDYWKRIDYRYRFDVKQGIECLWRIDYRKNIYISIIIISIVPVDLILVVFLVPLCCSWSNFVIIILICRTYLSNVFVILVCWNGCFYLLHILCADSAALVGKWFVLTLVSMLMHTYAVSSCKCFVDCAYCSFIAFYCTLIVFIIILFLWKFSFILTFWISFFNVGLTMC